MSAFAAVRLFLLDTALPIRRHRSRTTEENRRSAVLVMALILAMGTAMLGPLAGILESRNALVARFHETQREFRYAADAALAIGKVRLTHDTALALPDSGFVRLLSNADVRDVHGDALQGIRISLYAGWSSDTGGQLGKFVSLVAEAHDASGTTRYVRRLELAAESFAKYAMFTSNVPVIPLPPLSRLAALHDHAVHGNMDVVALGTNLTTARTRIEFVAVDLNDDGDLNDAEEGFLRVFQASDPDATRANYKGNVRNDQCGDWHDVDPGTAVRLEFFPVSVHDDDWFVARGFADAGPALIDGSRRHAIMSNTGARCFPAGDPHLVAVERVGIAGHAPTEWQKGGNDTTFTPLGINGRWLPFPAGTPEILNAIPTVRQAAEAPYLWPLHRTLNPGSKGVIHVHGPVLVSGVLRGKVTLYSSGDVGFVDDLTYAQDPAVVRCANLLGVIADGTAMIVHNGIDSPQRPLLTYLWTDDSQDWIFHGVLMSRTGALGVETGFLKNRGLDQCMLTDSPPYFPTTGRYSDNRYSEVDPAHFDPATLFQRLQGGL